ncbi:MMPL family transporter [Fictibacillus sp. KU28468]|uniref:MMPL family transporter n=1 Tax=Fictibacillus sp. KU28468 TaxID=2991053 RepID=UPI00223DEB61|nr:MMPL family transporter [Fictibacillus sp. KU28468]UZJ76982.1 MMPL family transporter [Fictibacillus sp. KU28468]
MRDKGIFQMIGKGAFKYRKLIIVFWVLVTAAFSMLAIKLPDSLSGSGFEMEGSFKKVENIMQKDFNQPKSSVMILFKSSNLSPDDPVYKKTVDEALRKLQSVDHAVSVTSPYGSPKMIKGKTAYATVNFDKSFDELKDSIKQIRKKTKSTKDMQIGITGGPVIAEDMNTASQKDLARAEAIGLPAALIILLLAFGGLIAAGLPIIIGLVSVVCAMGILFLIGQESSLTIFILNVVPMIGLALGIDFALLLVNRFREELERQSIEDAVVISVLTAGRSIAFSGFCVFLGLSGMLLIQIDIFRSVALGGMVVVIISVINALTFLPAVLAVLGKRINSFMLLRRKNGRSGWRKFASFVMKRPAIMLIFSVAILMLALIPVHDLKLSIPEAESLPPHYESRIMFERFEDTFGKKELYPVTIVADAGGKVLTDRQLLNTEKLVKRLEKEKAVEHVESLFSYTGSLTPAEILATSKTKQGSEKLKPVLDRYVKNDKTVIRVYLSIDVTSEKAKKWVKKWEGKENGLELILGGPTKFNQEIFDEIINKTPDGLSIVLLSTFVVLLIAFRSLFIPLKAILMNVISLSATFGILVWIFQSSYLMDPVSIGLMIPVFTFGIVFGLSMDYEVFLISRIQEVYQKTGDNDKATLEGLTSTSKIITSAAAIMIVITGSFIFTDVMPVKQIGIAIALAILIDATLVRMILVPSLMKLMGRWNWWLPFRRKNIAKNHAH